MLTRAALLHLLLLEATLLGTFRTPKASKQLTVLFIFT